MTAEEFNCREDAQAIFRAAVDRVDPSPMIERAVALEHGTAGEVLVVRTGEQEIRYDLGSLDRIFVTGMGKATARMALGLERALGSKITGGIIAVKEGHVEELERIRLIEASHPVPDSRSLAAAAAILDLGGTLGTRLTERDLVIVLVSGGGSSILCAPADGISFEEKAATTKLLLASGATIQEMNCVRKHLSKVKGGRLAAALAPASVLTLVLSDVIGDDLDAIASGPTVPDNTTFDDALAIAGRYGIEDRLPAPVLALLRAGLANQVPDTPKPDNPLFARTRTVLVGTNRLALESAASEARSRGYRSLVLTSRLEGEAREIAHVFLGIGRDISVSDFPVAKPACVIAGGETTVTLKGSGKGGRNQEMALAFLEGLAREGKDGEKLVFLSAGTDGNDGPTDAAGAVVDMLLLKEALVKGLVPAEYLVTNDSWTYFHRAGGHVITGPTNTNVCDVQVLLVT